MDSMNKPVDINPGMMPGIAQPLTGVIEVPVMDGCKAPHRLLRNHQRGCPELTEESPNQAGCTCRGTKVAFSKIFDVNGHNYLFTSACCMECIEAKHKKMLRAYLIHHGMKPGSIRLWWKVWRATW